MEKWIVAAALLLVTQTVTTATFAADVAVCTLSADKKTVTVTATNPYSQEMACEVNCHMALPNGIATIVCVKPVPAGAKNFVMCADKGASAGPYTRVKEASINCPDPTAKPAAIDKTPKDDDAAAKDDDDDKDAAPPPAGTKAKMKAKTNGDDDDDADADELIRKTLKEQQELMNQLPRK